MQVITADSSITDSLVRLTSMPTEAAASSSALIASSASRAMLRSTRCQTYSAASQNTSTM